VPLEETPRVMRFNETFQGGDGSIDLTEPERAEAIPSYKCMKARPVQDHRIRFQLGAQCSGRSWTTGTS
jgi:hypothetical protein